MIIITNIVKVKIKRAKQKLIEQTQSGSSPRPKIENFVVLFKTPSAAAAAPGPLKKRFWAPGLLIINFTILTNDRK